MARSIIAPALLGLAGLLFASAGTARAQDPQFFLPDGFEMVSVPFSAGLPVGLAFADERAFLVACKAGFVAYHDGVAQQNLPFINLSDEVNLNGDRGLLGIAAHPGFVPDGGDTSWVYLLYTVSPVFGEDFDYDEDDRYSYSRLTRYRAITLPDFRVVADETTRQVLIGHQLPDGTVPDGIASLHASHSNGALRFAPDGSLIISTGDGAHYDFVDTGGFDPAGFEDFVHPVSGLRGPTPQDQDSGAFRSQDLRSLAGKILRVDPETGSGYPSNPFYDGDVTSNASKVWALGLRNPFRVSLKPGTGSTDPGDGQPGVIYVGDVGWSKWEELDIVLGGENFGWPCYEGPWSEPGYVAYDAGSSPHGYLDCQDTPVGTLRGSILAWHHDDPALLQPSSAHTTWDGQPLGGFTGTCAIGGAHYIGTDYPEQYQGAYFFADFAGNWVRAVETDAQDNLLAVHDFGLDFGLIVGVEAHPITHELWFVMLGPPGQNLYRLRYSVDLTPTAVAGATPLLGDPPLAVQFDASGSSDPEEQPLTYLWDFGDGTPTSDLEQPVHDYLNVGLYTASLVVSDPGGNTDADSLQIAVGNTPPEARILSPTHGDFFTTPGSIVLSGEGSDIQDPTVQLSWSVDRHHDFHVHPAVFVAQGPQATFSIDPHGVTGDLVYYRVELLATDSGGLETRDHVFVYPRTHLQDVVGTALPISRMDELVPPHPTGTGNHDIEVVRDLTFPAPGSGNPDTQYDTDHSGAQGTDDWIGFELASAPAPEARFTGLVFQEGMHSTTGGWFEDFRVEVRRTGVWTPVANLRTVPDYPFELADQPGFDGSSFDVYSLSFDPAEGDAVRLRGAPGGSAGYISVGELRTRFVSKLPAPEPYEDVTAEGTIVSRLDELVPPKPTGTGNQDPETIRNGTTPPIGSASAFGQFDTYHDGDQGSSDWIGYEFAEEQELTRLVFQEGLHSTEGGRFQDLAVEVRHNPRDPWTPVTGLTITPPYPGDPSLAESYETFVLDFDPVHGRAVRLAGTPDGTVGYVSVGELRVFVPATPSGCPPVPDASNYCATAPNSAGPGATILLQGCTSVAENDFGLHLHDAVPGSSGLFYYGDAMENLPFGDGVRCVNGTTARILPPFVIDANGEAGAVLDLTAPSDPAVEITPGSTWYFQGWFRDPLGPGGTGFNLTDGLRVTFAP